jgi:hypothetical protein
MTAAQRTQCRATCRRTRFWGMTLFPQFLRPMITCQASINNVRVTIPARAGYCTGPVIERNGLRPTAPWNSRCMHTPGTWRGVRWCSIAHTDGPGRWGWAYPCASVPANTPCLPANRRTTLKRSQFAQKYYTARVVSSRRLTTGTCVYELRFADGDIERNVDQTRLRAPTYRKYAVCARVKGNFQGRGRWYSGRVTKVLANDRYMVQYDDGDKETLDSAKIQPVTTADTYTVVTYQANQAVMGNYRGDGRWYAGRIIAVNSRCSYNIRYGDGDTDTDMHPIFIRAAATPTRCTLAVGASVTGNWRGLGRWYPGRVTACASATGYSIAYADGSRETGVVTARIRAAVAATTAPACARNRYRVGQTITANWRGRGRYYAGRVTAAARCKYSITYSDGDTETNVTEANIRG